MNNLQIFHQTLIQPVLEWTETARNGDQGHGHHPEAVHRHGTGGARDAHGRPRGDLVFLQPHP